MNAMHWCLAKIYYSSGTGYQSRKALSKKLSRHNTLHGVFRMCGGLKNIGFDVPDENRGVSVRLKLHKLMREHFRERICPKL
jgi:hypothetical protein